MKIQDKDILNIRLPRWSDFPMPGILVVHSANVMACLLWSFATAMLPVLLPSNIALHNPVGAPFLGTPIFLFATSGGSHK